MPKIKKTPNPMYAPKKKEFKVGQMVEIDISQFRGDQSKDLEKLAKDPMGLLLEMDKYHPRGIIKNIFKNTSGRVFYEVRTKDGQTYTLSRDKLTEILD